ncbi:MAG: pyridoxine/pyridoxamine 5'-phosphate oxidase [Candidatus Pelagibacterales bacterium]|jgi:pyridoxamine 5'-phosphate oxidase|nr:MAG: pyridoxine/pyridoxamine 5'-phosphate oxidase [Pelagibacterales bacterium]
MSNDISNYNNWLDAWNDFYEKEKELVELDPNAALVSSVDAEGNPNARVILIKDVSNKGFVFYTNYQSQKGKELFHNNKGHLTWYSRAQGVSIRIQGEVQKIDASISDNYFASRDRNAQISASISKQSETVESREVLDAEFKKFADDYEGKEIPRPDHWGGVIIQPEKVEVWKSRDDYKTRLHDRIVFTLSNDQWIKSRLYP